MEEEEVMAIPVQETTLVGWSYVRTLISHTCVCSVCTVRTVYHVMYVCVHISIMQCFKARLVSLHKVMKYTFIQ